MFGPGKIAAGCCAVSTRYEGDSNPTVATGRAAELNDMRS